MLLIAGDLTTFGHPDEARVLAAEFAACRRRAGGGARGNSSTTASRGGAAVISPRTPGATLPRASSPRSRRRPGASAIAGEEGLRWRLRGGCAADFGEAEMKRFGAPHQGAPPAAGRRARRARRRLPAWRCRTTPVEATLRGESGRHFPVPRELPPGGGGGPRGLHGHAHAGARQGVTPGGVPVLNVAPPVIGWVYAVFALDAGTRRRARRRHRPEPIEPLRRLAAAAQRRVAAEAAHPLGRSRRWHRR